MGVSCDWFPSQLESKSPTFYLFTFFPGNTLLHIFGNWLFEAAVWEGQDQEGFPLRRKSHSSTTVISSAADISRLKDGSLSSLHQSQQRVSPLSSTFYLKILYRMHFYYHFALFFFFLLLF